uniref:TonB-dependent receptor domain-containing protein n=1 Tax=Prevotella sp. TaxID=59823 RepID=UPI004026D75A
MTLNYEKYKADYTRPDYGSTSIVSDKGKKDNDSISLQYKARLSEKLTNQFSVYRNKTTFKDNYGKPETDPWAMDMKTTGISDQLTYTANNQTLTGGVDWYKDEIPYYPGNAVEGQSTHNIAFYLQDKIVLTDQWNITPGVRVDHHSMFGTHTSPSVSIGYKQNDRTNYYLNYKSFFVAPNMSKLYGIYGNPDLKPQEGNTIEFGVNHTFSDSFTGTFNIFHTHAKNLIQYVNGYENTGKANVNGFSLNLNKDFNQHWNASIGYSFIHMPATAPNKNINSDGILPESTLNINVGYQADKFNANLSGRGIMNRYGNKTNNEMRNYANYWVWDLAANYQFTKEATLFARVNNIFDQFYTDVTSYCNGPEGSWYSAPGRNFEIGLQFQF